ncbi:hypothetical protein ABEB36_007087 [Hypothenemus hampei]
MTKGSPVQVNVCSTHRHLQQAKGTIQLQKWEDSIDQSGKLCDWRITTPPNTVVVLKMQSFNIGWYTAQENCVGISSFDGRISQIKMCSFDEVYIYTIAIASNEVLLSLNEDTHLMITFTSYVVNCSYNQLTCQTKSQNTCINELLKCPLKTGVFPKICPRENINCGLDNCYDVNRQRCNGVVDCWTAEDEIGCHENCLKSIHCSTENKCLQPKEICDETVDCQGGFDESHCDHFTCKNGCSEKSSRSSYLIYFLVILLGLMMFLFLFLMCNCFIRRNQVNHILDNQQEIPLPPFRGPGEGSTSIDDNIYHDADFRPGGEIFDSLLRNLETIKSRRKSEEVVIVKKKSTESQKVFQKYFHDIGPILSEELAALATIKISRDNCVGLRKTRSDERPMTKLLFVDDNDEESDDSDNRERQKRKANYRTTHSKSDTNYIERNTRESIKINI